tara:strand:+ start:924 stop:1241 length:318 start_codon:yes stop_codon:yes gene_type:complete
VDSPKHRKIITEALISGGGSEASEDRRLEIKIIAQVAVPKFREVAAEANKCPGGGSEASENRRLEIKIIAQVAELVDALVSNTNAFGRAGSTPALGTTNSLEQEY